ncbi:hypothetical protein KO507_10370, partial [Gilvimarinus agarilyticus]|nr:hypothetical protein [Gilvimarinus agarilyticus]
YTRPYISHFIKVLYSSTDCSVTNFKRITNFGQSIMATAIGCCGIPGTNTAFNKLLITQEYLIA